MPGSAARVRFGEHAAARGRHAERREKARRRHDAGEPLRRVARLGEIEALLREQSGVGERRRLLTPIDVIGNRDAGDRQAVARIGIVDVDEAFAIGVRQWFQQQRVDDAEDCGVGADAERERQHRGGEEAGARQQRTEAVAHVG